MEGGIRQMDDSTLDAERLDRAAQDGLDAICKSLGIWPDTDLLTPETYFPLLHTAARLLATLVAISPEPAPVEEMVPRGTTDTAAGSRRRRAKLDGAQVVRLRS
jgi:hypothetical protein